MRKTEAMEYCGRCQNFRLRFEFDRHHKPRYNIGGYSHCVLYGECFIPGELVRVEDGKMKVNVSIPDSVVNAIDDKSASLFLKSFVNGGPRCGMAFNIRNMPKPLVPYVGAYLMKRGCCMTDSDDKECCFHTERRLEEWNRNN